VNGDIVKVIEPISNGLYAELASGHRANIAYLLALVGGIFYKDLIVIDGEQEIPAARFMAAMYDSAKPLPDLVLARRPALAAAPEIDYEHQLAAMC